MNFKPNKQCKVCGNYTNPELKAEYSLDKLRFLLYNECRVCGIWQGIREQLLTRWCNKLNKQ